MKPAEIKHAIDAMDRKIESLEHENYNLRVLLYRMALKHGNEFDLRDLSGQEIPNFDFDIATNTLIIKP